MHMSKKWSPLDATQRHIPDFMGPVFNSLVVAKVMPELMLQSQMHHVPGRCPLQDSWD